MENETITLELSKAEAKFLLSTLKGLTGFVGHVFPESRSAKDLQDLVKKLEAKL